MTLRPIALLTLAALSLAGYSTLRGKRQRRPAQHPGSKPEAIAAWEGEGGGPGPGLACAPPADTPPTGRGAHPS